MRILLGLLAGALAGMLAVAALGVHRYTIPTGSMFPQVDPGERVYALERGAGDIERGDIIVFRIRPEWRRACGSHSDRFLKRVVGIPGDRVEIRYEQIRRNGPAALRPGGALATYRYPLPSATHPTRVYANPLRLGAPTPVLMVTPAGARAAAPLVIPGAMTPEGTHRFTPVPAGHFLVMGDNRPGSCDSRAWDQAGLTPFVAAEQVIAEVIVS